MQLNLLELCLAALLISAALPSHADRAEHGHQDDLLIHTLSGPVLGKYVYGSKRWLGIPFAVPPLGDLRFRSPQPVAPWSETLLATENPAACMQADGERMVYGRLSEDCLYLNIFAPIHANVSYPLPVMFWIYGGSLTVETVDNTFH
jgi:para-nitrobenzyl esterase